MAETANRRQRPDRNSRARRLDAVAAGKGRRDADRSAAIGPQLEGAHAEHGGCRRSAGRSTRRLARVPRIAGHAGEGAVGNGLPAEFRHRGFADDDRTVLAKPGDCRRVMRLRLRGGQSRAEPGRHAGDQDVVLDADRNAVEEPLGHARHPARFGLVGATQRALTIDVAIGVDDAVEALDPFQDRAHGLHRRQNFPPVAGDKFARRQIGDSRGGHGR